MDRIEYIYGKTSKECHQKQHMEMHDFVWTTTMMTSIDDAAVPRGVEKKKFKFFYIADGFIL
jgi:hypothetical protein